MAGRSPHARSLVSDTLGEIEDGVETPVVSNAVVDADDGDDLIWYLADAAAEARNAEAEAGGLDRDYGDRPLADAAGDAYSDLAAAVETRAEELVAERLADVIEHADEWATEAAADPDGWHSPEDYHGAADEAEQWLAEHAETARRADVDDDLLDDLLAAVEEADA